MDPRPNTPDQDTTENIIETLKNADQIILKRTESINVLQISQRELEAKNERSLEDETKLANIQESLDQKQKELDDALNLSNRLLTKLQEDTSKLIDSFGHSLVTKSKYPDLVQAGLKKSHYDSEADFSKVLVVNQDDIKKTLPQILILESKREIEELHNICQSCSWCTKSDSNEDSSSNCSSDCSQTIKNDAYNEMNMFKLKHDVCVLKEHLQNVINENRELRFKLNALAEKNDVFAEALKLPAAFKTLKTGEIIFPGKKEMEKKYSFLKAVIIKLNGDVAEVQRNRMKLKSAKEFISQYSVLIDSCQCGHPSFKENIQTAIKVKKQKYEQLKYQIKQKNNELNAINVDYNSGVEKNKRVFCKAQKLTEDIIKIKKDIEGYSFGNIEDIKNQLNKKYEEIETLELVIKERKDEINNCDENINKVCLETKEITEKTGKLEESVKSLTDGFNDAYNNLECVYQDQLEEMMALPVLVKATHIKIQEEIDLKMLAEETRDKLERKIREVETSKTPFMSEDVDEKQAKIKAENKALQSKLKMLKENINSATEDLDKETKELADADRQVKDAIDESARHINAFKMFSTIHLERIVKDVQRVQELLTEFQSKECAKAIIKKTVMEHLNHKVDSIRRNVVGCQSEVKHFLEQLDEMC